MKKTVVLIDDHKMLLEGLEVVIDQLENSIEVITYNDCESALNEMSADTSLVLVDLHFPGMSGLEFLRALDAKDKSPNVAVLSASTDSEDIRNVFRWGAKGYIPKSYSSKQLSNALREMLDNESYISKRFAHLSLATDDRILLSARKAEILHLIEYGLPNKTIAHRLDISETTVKTHIALLFNLLGVSNRTECVNEAKRLGLLNR